MLPPKKFGIQSQVIAPILPRSFHFDRSANLWQRSNPPQESYCVDTNDWKRPPGSPAYPQIQAVTFGGQQYPLHRVQQTFYDLEIPPRYHDRVIADLRAKYSKPESLPGYSNHTSQSGQQGSPSALGQNTVIPNGELFLTP
jgi:hypothetical protein